MVVVGSGYGGGVAASRLARAGQSVCVIEKGKEFLTGEFPSRLPEIRRELQLNGAKLRSGSRTGLFDFRLGADIHVLVGCGLGGGSLINAGVALKPDPRVFADPAWPEELRRDGLLELGFARAAAMLRPARYRNAAVADQVSRARSGEREPSAFPGRGACRGELRGHRQSGGRLAARLHALRRLLLGLQCRRQEHRRHDLSPRRQGAWRGDLHRAQREPRRQGGGRLARPFRTLERSGVRHRPSSMRGPSCLPRARSARRRFCLRSREAGLGLSDRLGEKFSANGDIIAFALGGSERVNGVGVGHPPKFVGDAIGACVAGQIELADGEVLDRSMILQEGVMPSALAPLLPVFFIAGRQAARRRAEPDQGRLSRPAVASAYLLRRLARRRGGPHHARQRQCAAPLAWRGRSAGLCPRR